MRNPSLAGLLARIKKLETDVRNLRLRKEGDGPVAAITDITSKLYDFGGKSFVPSDVFVPGYYVDRGRCYLTGAVKWDGGTASDTAQFLFAGDGSDAMTSQAKPTAPGWTRIHIPYDWQNSGPVFLPGEGTTQYSAEGAFVEALVIGDAFDDSVYIEFKDTVLPFPNHDTSADAVKTATDYAKRIAGVADQGILTLEGISWRVA